MPLLPTQSGGCALGLPNGANDPASGLQGILGLSSFDEYLSENEAIKDDSEDSSLNSEVHVYCTYNIHGHAQGSSIYKVGSRLDVYRCCICVRC